MKTLAIFLIFFPIIISAQPNPEFSATPLVVCAGAPVNFTDLSTSTNPIVSWTWNFGDGNGSTQQNPQHIYSVAGPKNITLTVFDGTTAVPIVKTAYILVNPLPVPSFVIATSGCTLPVNALITNVQPNTGHSFSWNFGNGQTSTQLTPTGISYSTAGTYQVNLQVTSTQTGCVNSVQQTINVANFSTDFAATAQSICAGESISFTDQSMNANQWNWNFGNGSSSSSQNPQNTYSNPGTYNVTLTSNNTVSGCSGTETMTIVVHPNPVPSFLAAPTFGCSPLPVDFSINNPINGSYTWNFGNGTSFIGEAPPTVMYNSNGEYNVTLTVEDENGCIGETTLVEYITVTPLIIDFEADVIDGCEDLEVQFADLSNAPNPSDDPITGWVWDFGNGNTFSGQVPPVQTYSEGEYEVSLTISTDNGCVETISIPEFIRVGKHSVVDFTVDQVEDCAKQPFVFTNNSLTPLPFDEDDLLYEWSFGDGGGSTQENPTYTYPIDTGFFDVQLIVNYRGCRDTMVQPNLIFIKAPISLFSLSQSVFCNPILPINVTALDNAILGAEPEDVQMIWTWGDGTNNLLEDADLYDADQGTMSHTFNAFGTYTIKQVVHNYVTGCSDSTQQIVTMSNIDANFNLSTDTICLENSVTMTNTSVSTDPITEYTYFFGDGSPIENNPITSHVYNQPGSYPITLMVENQLGCINSQVINLTVLPRPIAQIDVSHLIGCAPLPVSYSAPNSTPNFSLGGQNLATFDWTFPDNSTQTTNDSLAIVTHLLTTEGTFTTSLVVTDQYGCISFPSSVNTTITKPLASFVAPSFVCSTEDFVAVNNSQNGVQYQWNVDGINSGNSAPDPTFSFDETGSSTLFSVGHSIQLIVTDVNGCKDTSVQVVTVSLPYANPSYQFDGANVNAQGDFICPPVFAELTDNSSSVGSIATWNWTFGDGNLSVLENPDNTYVFAGVYTATLEITDEYGCVDDTVLFEYLSIGGPTGEVSWQLVGDVCNPQYLFVTDNLVNVTTITWELGDGSTHEGIPDFYHEYNTQGTYFPIAYLQDGNGCSVAYDMNQINVLYSELNANFSVSPSGENFVGDEVFLDDLSTGGIQGIQNWYWNTGEASYVLQNTGDNYYVWNTPGNHVITLIIEDFAGCVDTISVPIFISIDVEVPNVFTPNGDGINDYFQLPYDIFTSYDVVIVNRWGNLIYEGYGQTTLNMWNGTTMNGTMCTEGVYFYRVQGNNLYDGKPMDKHGFVTLEK